MENDISYETMKSKVATDLETMSHFLDKMTERINNNPGFASLIFDVDKIQRHLNRAQQHLEELDAFDRSEKNER